MYPTGCVPEVLWPSQDPQARHSSKAYCVWLWICHLWCGKGTCQNTKTLSWQVPLPYQQSQDLVEQVKHITLAPGECLSSHDVSGLFTSVPIDKVLFFSCPSDLMTSTVVDESLSSTNNYSSVPEKINLLQTSTVHQFNRSTHQIYHRTPRNRWTLLPRYLTKPTPNSIESTVYR